MDWAAMEQALLDALQAAWMTWSAILAVALGFALVAIVLPNRVKDALERAINRALAPVEPRRLIAVVLAGLFIGFFAWVPMLRERAREERAARAAAEAERDAESSARWTARMERLRALGPAAIAVQREDWGILIRWRIGLADDRWLSGPEVVVSCHGPRPSISIRSSREPDEPPYANGVDLQLVGVAGDLVADAVAATLKEAIEVLRTDCPNRSHSPR